MAHIARIIRPCLRTWKATRSDGVEGKMKRSTWIARTERLGGKSTSECACEIVFGEPSNYHTYCANRNWQDAWDVKEHWHVIFANRLFIQPANNGGADAVLGAPRPRVCQYICVYSVSLCPWANIHSIHIPHPWPFSALHQITTQGWLDFHGLGSKFQIENCNNHLFHLNSIWSNLCTGERV